MIKYLCQFLDLVFNLIYNLAVNLFYRKKPEDEEAYFHSREWMEKHADFRRLVYDLSFRDLPYQVEAGTTVLVHKTKIGYQIMIAFPGRREEIEPTARIQNPVYLGPVHPLQILAETAE